MRSLLTPEDPEEPRSEVRIDTARSYDLNSRMTSATDGNGNATQYAYNARNRMTSVTYPDGP